MPPQNPYNPYGVRFSGDPTMSFRPSLYAEDLEVGPNPNLPVEALKSLARNTPGQPQGARPLPVPSLETQADIEQESEQDSPYLQRLAALGIPLSAVDKVTPGWGKGYTATGATGSGPAQPSTTKFGTANIRPGAFAIGGVDPSQRQFMVERGNQIAEKSRRELSNFLNINAPTGTRDNYGTTDPMQDARIRAARAAAVERENTAMGPLPEITVDDPEQVELAGGQAAYNAQKLAEARLAAATSPLGQEAQAMDTRSRAQIAAAPYAMSIDAGPEAKNAFLEFMFGKLQEQGMTPQDIAEIAAATNMTPEEVKARIAKAQAAKTPGVR